MGLKRATSLAVVFSLVASFMVARFTVTSFIVVPFTVASLTVGVESDPTISSFYDFGPCESPPLISPPRFWMVMLYKRSTKESAVRRASDSSSSTSATSAHDPPAFNRESIRSRTALTTSTIPR
ncbi:MAG: hypothetical protein ACFWT0_04450 [Bifidobacterium crudilactis]